MHNKALSLETGFESLQIHKGQSWKHKFSQKGQIRKPKIELFDHTHVFVQHVLVSDYENFLRKIAALGDLGLSLIFRLSAIFYIPIQQTGLEYYDHSETFLGVYRCRI